MIAMTATRAIHKRFAPDSSRAIPPARQGSSAVVLLYAVTIFLSAFLLFLVEPVIAKLILPWFGGMSSVWTTCMLFFQSALFAGYAYAHVLSVRLNPRLQAALHGVLLLAACLVLPIVPSDSWKPLGDEEPVKQIILVLCATVGLPFFVLSSSGPLLQRWFSRTRLFSGSDGGSTYRLYALSNAGSLLALLLYPAGFEWLLGTSTTARWWSWSFVAFAVLCGGCALVVARRELAIPAESAASNPPTRPSWGTWLLWFGLSMVPSVLLLATTNAVCQDVASVPFLWILPLSLYLLSFVLCFQSERWCSRLYLMPAAALALGCECGALYAGSRVPLPVWIFVNFMTLFLCAMACHGELARRRPHVAHLTSFYLLIAAGGAGGGIFVAVIAPLIFKDYYELYFGLFGCAALMLVALGADRDNILFGGRRPLFWGPHVLCLGLYGLFLYGAAWAKRDKNVIALDRNFYGVLRVVEQTNADQEEPYRMRKLINGSVMHGVEFTDPPEWTQVPTTYYGPKSGIGLALSLPRNKPRRVGIIGLGAGTLAAYARPGDYYRFYEINAQVESLARDYFHYLDGCRGTVEVVHGDARLELERECEKPQHFDVMVVDAFTGDAIPVHLLTVEAFGIYLRHLAPDGIIAVHITNRYFALRPVVAAIADVYRLAFASIQERYAQGVNFQNTWILVARDAKVFQAPSFREVASPSSDSRILWTDDYSSLFAVWISRNDPTRKRQSPDWDAADKTRPSEPTPSEWERLTALWAKVGPLELSRTTTPEELIATLGEPTEHRSDPESYSWGKFDAVNKEDHVTRRTRFFAAFEVGGLKTFRKTEPVYVEGAPLGFRENPLMRWEAKEKKFLQGLPPK